MSLKLMAPLPMIQTTTILPSPQLADVDSRLHEIEIFRATNGAKRTSVKSNARRRLTYDFLLNRLKAEELKRFMQSYYQSKIRVVDHKGQVWEGYIMSNPLSFSPDARERVSVQVQFEGIKVS